MVFLFSLVRYDAEKYSGKVGQKKTFRSRMLSKKYLGRVGGSEKKY